MWCMCVCAKFKPDKPKETHQVTRHRNLAKHQSIIVYSSVEVSSIVPYSEPQWYGILSPT